MNVIKALGIDLGNGFVKMYSDTKTLVEQAVFCHAAEVDFNNSNSNSITISDKNIYVGQDAIDSGLDLRSAVGRIDAISRYSSEEYINLMYAFIFLYGDKNNIEIDNLVLGLPNNHFKSCKEVLKNNFENRKVIINQKIIKINNVVVLPQPYGGYLGSQLGKSTVAIVDLGQGTVDYTILNKNGEIIDMFSTEDGVKKYYLATLQYLKGLFPTHDLKLEDIPIILKEGIKDHRGNYIDITDETIKEIKSKHTTVLLTPIIEKYNYLTKFDNILFIGGGAEVYKEEIIALAEHSNNIKIGNDPQILNAKGFYLFANSMSKK